MIETGKRTSSMPELKILMNGLEIGESPRWHEDRLWFSNWGAQEVIAVDLDRGVPDGLCLDAENAIWCGDVPNKRCVRVREGGEVLQTQNLDRGCFACMLGGLDKRTLFLMAAEWCGPASMAGGRRTGQVLTIEGPVPGRGWP